MSRIKVKPVVSNPSEDFIPDTHKEYSVSAEKMVDRPLIIVGKMPTRDQNFIIKDMISAKDNDDTSKGVTGWGAASKYIWFNLITEVKNLITDKDEIASVKGEDKDKLWDSEGMEYEIDSATLHFYIKGKLTDEEVKTSV